MGNCVFLTCPEVDLSGKVAIVTGGNSGIGYETAKGLASMGAHTIIACRSKERAEEAIARMEREVSAERADIEVKVEFMALDLASLRSTKEFTLAFRERNLPLHILINNAAVAMVDFTKTIDGFELQFQVNHLSHLLLTLELLPTLLVSASHTRDCRIVFITCQAYSWSHWEPDNMNGELEYSPLGFYFQSKLYNIMTAYALQRRLQGVGITISSLHPGMINTDITRHATPTGFVYCLSKAFFWLAGRSANDGAAASLNCAVNPELNSQQCIYYSELSPIPSNTTSRNMEYQEDLWRRSIDMINDYLTPWPTVTQPPHSDPVNILPAPLRVV